MTVLVDSSAFYALLDRDDPSHGKAVRAFEALRLSGEPILTHEYVIVESIALVQRRLGMGLVSRLLLDLLPLAEVQWVDRQLHLDSRDSLLAAGRRGVSLVDWVSFLVMRRRGIRTAFAFDPDFAAEGFEVIPEPR